jgi:hypothetical protein
VPTDPSYFDSGGRDDVLSGGVKLIPVNTPRCVFRVWTKRVGNNPRTRLLLLHWPVSSPVAAGTPAGSRPVRARR